MDKNKNKILKTQLLRFAQMYTNFNLFFIITWFLWPSLIQEFVRANSLIIMFAMSYFWITGTNWGLYMDFYRSLPTTLIPKMKETAIVPLFAVVDLAVHLLPVLLIGLPIVGPFVSIIAATACVLAWYLVVRQDNRIQKIYLETLPIKTYDSVISWGIFCALLVAVFLAKA